jgi:pyruvate/2-oxoglutarate dehydrogenase complex dihydrolipoamide dehydrogenase (E3) component
MESELVGEGYHYRACVPSKSELRPLEALVEVRQVDYAKQAARREVNVQSVLAKRGYLLKNS